MLWWIVFWFIVVSVNDAKTNDPYGDQNEKRTEEAVRGSSREELQTGRSHEMKFRALLVLIAFALAGAVACGGGDKKKDEPPTEETMEEGASESEGTSEEAPAETAPMEDDTAAEEGVEGEEAEPEGASDAEGGE